MMNNRSGGFREDLRESHVAAATIAVLLFLTLAAFFDALWTPAYRVIEFVVTVIAVLDIPSRSLAVSSSDRFLLITSCAYLYTSLVCFLGAWLLSRWVYEVGPLPALRHCAGELLGRQGD